MHNAGSLCFPGFLMITDSVPFNHSCSARHDCLLRNRKRVVSVMLSGLRLVDWRQEIRKESTQSLWQTRQDVMRNMHAPLFIFLLIFLQSKESFRRT